MKLQVHFSGIEVTYAKFVEQTIKLPVIWDVMTFMWHHCNVLLKIDVFNEIY